MGVCATAQLHVHETSCVEDSIAFTQVNEIGLN